MGKEVIRFENLDVMQDIMAKNALAVTKADALDLPPTTDTMVGVNMSATEAKAYIELKDDLVANLDLDETATVPNRLTQMLRLRQVTSGHLPTDSGAVATLGSSKVDAIVSIAHDNLAGEKRIVVFCFFTHEIHDAGQGAGSARAPWSRPSPARPATLSASPSASASATWTPTPSGPSWWPKSRPSRWPSTNS